MRTVVLLAALAFVCLTFSCSASAFGDVFAVLQDSAGMASVVTYNGTGDVTATSPIHWNFRWPVTEATLNTIKKQISVITFPNPTAEATLFTFDFSLGAPVNTQKSSNFSYFDLQFSPRQNTYYGIAVSSRYGRVLSHFTDFNEPVAHKAIGALPYMWYVNASTFDYDNSRYYGLINNFPGFPNSTSEQRMAVGHFGETIPRVEIQQMFIPSDILIRFISYSNPTKSLFALANIGSDTTAILELNVQIGTYAIRTKFPNTIAQPMFASATTPTLHFFVKNTVTNRREFIHVDITTWSSRVTKTYVDNQRVVAVAGLE